MAMLSTSEEKIPVREPDPDQELTQWSMSKTYFRITMRLVWIHWEPTFRS
jgi:hypothetical protein